MRKGLCFMMLVLWMYALIATIGLSLIIYLFECFPTATMIEIIYAIKSPSGSLSFSLYLPIILYFLLPCIIQVIIYITLSFSLKKTRLKKVSFFILSTISILVFGLYLEIKLDAIEYIQNYRKRSDFIENNYVDPQNVKLTFPEKKRNLIHIVLESMELSFADKVNGGVMNANRIPHLVQLAKEGETFAGELGNDILNGGIPVYGTGWTMGATFAMETGLPLKIGGNEMSSEKNFYNSIVTIGDTLYKNGYNNYVMLGSDSTFAGNDNFYRLHGDNTVIDYKYAAKNKLIPDGYRVWWGFEDEKLFEITKNKILSLAKENKFPFNLTVFTIDTHFPDGYLTDSCEIKFDDQYSNVIFCSDNQVYQFVNWLKEQPFYEDTTVVITGDHLTMNGDYLKDYEQDKRRTYINIINAPIEPSNRKRRLYSTLDIFPTILASIGVKIDGDYLGLGANLFSDKETLLEKIGINKLNEELKKRSVFFEQKAEIQNLYALGEKNRSLFQETSLFTPFYEQFERLNNSVNNNFLTCISLRKGTKLNQKMIKFLKDYGFSDLEINDSNNIALVLHGDNIILKEMSENSIFSHVSQDSNIVSIHISDSLDDSFIKIDGINYQKNKSSGLDVLVYDINSNSILANGSYNANSDILEDRYYKNNNEAKGIVETTNVKNKKKYIFCRESFNCFLNSYKEYFTEDNVLVLAVYDEATGALSDSSIDLLSQFGLKTELKGKWRNSYAAILQNGKFPFESISPDNKIALRTTRDGRIINVLSSGFIEGVAQPGLCEIKVDGIDYCNKNRGFNVVVINKDDGVVFADTFDTCASDLNFDVYTDQYYTSLLVPKSQNKAISTTDNQSNFCKKSFSCFLNSYKENRTSNDILLLSIQDEGTQNLSSNSLHILSELGVKTDLQGKFRNSFSAVVGNEKFVSEKISSDKAILLKTTRFNHQINILSSGLNTGTALCKIEIDGVDYCKNQRGFNVVVFNNDKGIVFSEGFDTFLSDEL